MKTLSRRTLLKGAGVLMGLPWLEAMGPLQSLAHADTPNPNTPRNTAPVRLAILYMANGVNPHAWTPATTGPSFELSPILQPLSPLRDQLLVLTQLWNASANTGDGHYVKTGGFLTSTTITRTTGSNLCSGGVSVDQLAAQHVGNLTPLPSLELGIEPVTTGVDTNVGFTRLYGSHISWSSPTTPLAKEINPRLAFDRLFRSNGNNRPTAFADQSVIDLVRDDAKRLEREVGHADRLKLQEYLDSVRAIEKRIEFDARRKAAQTLADPLALKEIEKLDHRITDYYNDPARASERTTDHGDHVRLMLDILALAFWTDSTRVGTFMFGNAVSGRNFSFLQGVSGGHHQISHHENDAKKLEEYRRINVWHIEQYAYLLQKLHSIREGESTLLGNSMIVLGAGMRDGNAHSPHNLPLVLAGSAGGTLATGRHIAYPKDTPLSNLYRSLLARMGTPVQHFADSTGELPGLSDPQFTGKSA